MPFVLSVGEKFDFERAETDEYIGENLIIEVKEYQPTVVPASLMEEQSIPVRAVLSAARSNIIDVPKNIRVRIKLLDERAVTKINTSLKGTSKEIKSKYYRSHSWRPNPYLTLDNLGYLEIKLKKIPKEEEVPERIDLDFRAEITYKGEKTELDIGGNPTLNLPVESEEEFNRDLDRHMFWNGAGYVRVKEATDKYIKLQFYDADLQRKYSPTVYLGRTSGRMKIEGHPLYDYYRVKYNGLIDEDIKVKFKFKEDDKEHIKEFAKNEEVVNGWKVSKINKNEGYVILRNNEINIEIPLVYNGYSTEYKLNKDKLSFRNIEELYLIYEEECIDSDKGCVIYDTLNRELSDDFVEKTYTEEEKGKFQEGLDDLESKGLVSFEGFGINIRKVRVKIGDNVYVFEGEFKEGVLRKIIKKIIRYGEEEKKEEKDGSSISISDRCELVGIGKTYINIRYTGSDLPERSKRSQSLKVGESITEFDCGQPVTFLGPSTDIRASFTILAGEGRGKSISDFSIHIPIEKRAWSLSPDEIDEQIRKTREKIEDLDRTINKLNKVVEGWTKVCLSTAAVFTVWSFFSGLGGSEQTKAATVKPSVETGDVDGLNYYGMDGTWKTLPDRIYMDEDGNCYLDEEHRVRISCNMFRTEGEEDQYKYYFVDEEGNLKLAESDGVFSKSKNSALYGKAIVFGNNGDVTIPIHTENALPTGDSKCRDNYNKFIKGNNKDAAIFLHWDRSQKIFNVFHAGYDGEINYYQKPGEKDDYLICYFDENSDEGKRYTKKLSRVIKAKNSGKLKINFEGTRYKIDSRAITDIETVNCEDVMSPTQCLILYNACDPVICPSSRCNFGGQYQVDNVIQSGLIGSTMLCLPNIKQGVVMPVCLSGILASLKTIRSVLDGYINCLEAAKVSGKSIGICDKIRSIYICEIIWKEMLVFLRMKGGVIGWLFDSTVGAGGGEYLRGGFESAGKTVDFFTNNYAKNVFAAYKGRAAEEIGSEICKSAIYGKTPWYGDIVGKVADAQDPPQFTVYFEEHEYSDIGRKKQSRYQVYYHIYAGSNDIDYKIYLKKPGRSYRVAYGRLEKGGFIDANPDFIEESGFKEVCVYINGREYCGFGKVVSTSFAIDAIHNYMMGYSMGKKIGSEEECRSANLGIQEYIPYAQVRRICSSIDPNINKGRGEDWIKVGTCGKNKEGVYLGDCWEEVGEIKDKNPELFSSVSMMVCNNQGYDVCDAGEKCNGEEERIVVGKGNKDIICCSEECIKDEGYEALKTEIKNVGAKDDVYKRMKERAESICEDSGIVGDNPFEDAYDNVIGWRAKENELNDLDNDDNEKVVYHNYFKGLMYLMCKDCGKAKESFSKIDMKNEYYEKACGIMGDGGIYKDVCGESCKDLLAEIGDFDIGRGTPLPLKVEKVVVKLDDYDGNVIEENYILNIDEDGKIDKTIYYPGILTIKSVEFNHNIETCEIKEISYLNHKSKILERIENLKGESSGNLCKIDNKVAKFNLINLFEGNFERLNINIAAESHKDLSLSYDGSIKIEIFPSYKVGDRGVLSGSEIKSLLCYYPRDINKKYYSCLTETGKKCIDYDSNNYPLFNKEKGQQQIFYNPNDCFDYCSNLQSGGCILTEYKDFAL
jgi:hypothetical protein